MKNKFIKVCKSYFGDTTCVYLYVNIQHIVEIELSTHGYLEGTLINGRQVILPNIREFKKLRKEVNDHSQSKSKKGNDYHG